VHDLLDQCRGRIVEAFEALVDDGPFHDESVPTNDSARGSLGDVSVGSSYGGGRP